MEVVGKVEEGGGGGGSGVEDAGGAADEVPAREGVASNVAGEVRWVDLDGEGAAGRVDSDDPAAVRRGEGAGRGEQGKTLHRFVSPL